MLRLQNAIKPRSQYEFTCKLAGAGRNVPLARFWKWMPRLLLAFWRKLLVSSPVLHCSCSSFQVALFVAMAEDDQHWTQSLRKRYDQRTASRKGLASSFKSHVSPCIRMHVPAAIMRAWASSPLDCTRSNINRRTWLFWEHA